MKNILWCIFIISCNLISLAVAQPSKTTTSSSLSHCSDFTDTTSSYEIRAAIHHTLTPTSLLEIKNGITRNVILRPADSIDFKNQNQFWNKVIYLTKRWLSDKFLPDGFENEYISTKEVSLFHEAKKIFFHTKWNKVFFHKDSLLFIDTVSARIPGSFKASGRYWAIRLSSKAPFRARETTTLDIILHENPNDNSIALRLRVQRGRFNLKSDIRNSNSNISNETFAQNTRLARGSGVVDHLVDSKAISNFDLFDYLLPTVSVSSILNPEEKLTYHAEEIMPQQFRLLLAWAENPLRHLPLVIIPPLENQNKEISFPYPPDIMARELFGLAHVLYFTDTEKFNEQFSQNQLKSWITRPGDIIVVYPVEAANSVSYTKPQPPVKVFWLLPSAYNPQSEFPHFEDDTTSNPMKINFDENMYRLVRNLSWYTKDREFPTSSLSSPHFIDRTPISLREIRMLIDELKKGRKFNDNNEKNEET